LRSLPFHDGIPQGRKRDDEVALGGRRCHRMRGVGAAPFTLLLPQAQKFVIDTLRENVCNVLFWFYFFKASRKLSIFHLSMVIWVFLWSNSACRTLDLGWPNSRVRYIELRNFAASFSPSPQT
jgi:hypothetical protein